MTYANDTRLIAVRLINQNDNIERMTMKCLAVTIRIIFVLRCITEVLPVSHKAAVHRVG